MTKQTRATKMTGSESNQTVGGQGTGGPTETNPNWRDFTTEAIIDNGNGLQLIIGQEINRGSRPTVALAKFYDRDGNEHRIQLEKRGDIAKKGIRTRNFFLFGAPGLLNGSVVLTGDKSTGGDARVYLKKGSERFSIIDGDVNFAD